MPESSDSRLRLTPTQKRLYEALTERRVDLGEWYLASIAIMNDHGLPDRLSLAAHALREVIEKLPADTISVDRSADLPTKLRNLRPSWDLAYQENQRFGGSWNGEISEPLRDFLTGVGAFFEGQDQLVATRRQNDHRFFGSLDGTAGLPDDMQRENLTQWSKFRGYFISVAHHKGVQEQQFREQIAAFEFFLSNRLKPRPIDDFAIIDALLEED